MQILLIAGLWLDASAWDTVLGPLRAHGHDATAVALPGQGAPPRSATLEDQRDAVLAALDATDQPTMLVSHSAATTLAWLACDARPDRVAHAVMIGGFPSADGAEYANFFKITDGVMPFPGWEPFAGADSADLDQAQRGAIAAAAIPVPEAVAKGLVHLTDQRRYTVPITIICPEFSADQARQWIRDGDVPELASAQNVDCVDINSGHWPMFTRPVEIGNLLATIADA
ncbi:MAG: alpha/beta fold hydrolase [Solirubrobacteraceae bacterium]